MQRKANAIWRSGLQDGRGSISTDSKLLSDAPYSFRTRFENAPGTNPEELVAAAHAACFSMALSAELQGRGFKPERISTDATATLEKREDGWLVTEMHLDVIGDIPGVLDDAFKEAAHAAETGCPISRLLNTKITMNAELAKKAA